MKIVFLCFSSHTVNVAFTQAIEKYGVPKLLRTDHGGENVLVWEAMNQLHGPGHVIKGRSVHNQRIERLWRDVRTLCTQLFREVFWELEDQDHLNPDDDVDIEVGILVIRWQFNGHYICFGI